MKLVKRMSAIILGAALVMVSSANSLRAGKPQTIPVWFDDAIVYAVPGNNDNVVGITNQAIANKVANPLYVVAGQEVSHVFGEAIPGVKGYNPHWDVITVTVNNGRNVIADPFTSEDEILEAADNGEVTLTDTGFILLCQVIGK